ncbi:hypothetical protein GCM10023063_19600 [Arthrobacter methylotrophus]|uniref:Uncharacterized protein n=1 Tax=Arthrobacter methylotrophus TaxID=121291 RepID=A0ABV5UR66_9MICC
MPFSSIPANFKASLRSARGAFDLPSILVGVVVVGILAAGVLASIFGIIPFAQDNGAKQDLAAVKTAEGVSKAQAAAYKDKAGLVAAPYMGDSSTLAVGTNTAKDCYVGLSKSGSGKIFYNSDSSPDPQELTPTTTTGCVDPATLSGMVTQVGGFSGSSTASGAPTGTPSPTTGTGTGTGALPAGYTWSNGVLDTNYVTDPSFELGATGWSKPAGVINNTFNSSVVKSISFAAGQGIGGSNAVQFTTSGTIQPDQANIVAFDLPTAGYGQINMSISSPSFSGSSQEVYASVANYAADGSFLSESSPVTASVGGSLGWAAMNMQRPWMPTPAGGSLKLLVRAGANYDYAPLENAVFYVDDVSSTDNGQYFDGQSAASGEYSYKWSGVQYDSPSQKITPKQVALPSVITLGQQFTVQGRGFPANTAVHLEDNDWQEGPTDVTTDSSGNFTTAITFPANTDPNNGLVAGPGTLHVFSGASQAQLYLPITLQ